MKLKTILAVTLGVGLSPTLAFCAEGGGGGGSWLMLGFYIVNFALFAAILVYGAGPLTVKFFRERAREIRENIELSEKGFRSASQTAQAAQAQVAGLETEKARILKEMREETAREMARLRELGEATARRIRHDAELTARSIADSGRRTVQTHLAAAAARMARQLIAANFEAADQTRLVREFLDTVSREARP